MYGQELDPVILKDKQAHGKAALKGFLSLIEELKPLWTSMWQKYGRVEAKEHLRYALQNSRKFNRLLCTYFLVELNDEDGAAKDKMINLFLRATTRRLNEGIREQVRKKAESAYIPIETAKMQGDYLKEIPLSLRKYLPNNIVIETDPKGTISKITEAFGNKAQDIGYKIDQMAGLIEKWDSIQQDVSKDLDSNDPKKKACATLVGIIMETGIRPGAEGTHSIDDEGDEIQTYGATTLKGEHISFHRDGTASLEFHGKSGTLNRALIRNKAVVNALRQFVEKRGDGLVFKLKGRGPVTQDELNEYIKKNVGEFTATDFRKLKASKAVYESLRRQENSLRNSFKDFKTEAKSNIQARLILEIKKTLDKAVSEAQKSLNHMEDDVTIQHYINPLIILSFLSNGKVEETLEKAVLSNKPTLRFSPDTFLRNK